MKSWRYYNNFSLSPPFNILCQNCFPALRYYFYRNFPSLVPVSSRKEVAAIVKESCVSFRAGMRQQPKGSVSQATGCPESCGRRRLRLKQDSVFNSNCGRLRRKRVGKCLCMLMRFLTLSQLRPKEKLCPWRLECSVKTFHPKAHSGNIAQCL